MGDTEGAQLPFLCDVIDFDFTDLRQDGDSPPVSGDVRPVSVVQCQDWFGSRFGRPVDRIQAGGQGKKEEGQPAEHISISHVVVLTRGARWIEIWHVLAPDQYLYRGGRSK